MSYCLFASNAGFTKLSNYFFGVYSTKRCFFMETTPNSRWKKETERISEPFCNVELAINIFRGLDSSLSSSAYVFIGSHISLSLTKIFLKIGRKLTNLVANVSNLVPQCRIKHKITSFGFLFSPWS